MPRGSTAHDRRTAAQQAHRMSREAARWDGWDAGTPRCSRVWCRLIGRVQAGGACGGTTHALRSVPCPILQPDIRVMLANRGAPQDPRVQPNRLDRRLRCGSQSSWDLHRNPRVGERSAHGGRSRRSETDLDMGPDERVLLWWGQRQASSLVCSVSRETEPLQLGVRWFPPAGVRCSRVQSAGLRCVSRETSAAESRLFARLDSKALDVSLFVNRRDHRRLTDRLAITEAALAIMGSLHRGVERESSAPPRQNPVDYPGQRATEGGVVRDGTTSRSTVPSQTEVRGPSVNTTAPKGAACVPHRSGGAPLDPTRDPVPGPAASNRATAVLGQGRGTILTGARLLPIRRATARHAVG